MTALPKEILDRGLGQECWANWLEDERRWTGRNERLGKGTTRSPPSLHH